MVGMGECSPGNDVRIIEGRVIGGMDVVAVIVGLRDALRDDHGEGLVGGQRNGRAQGDGVVAGEGQGAGRGGHQAAGGGVAGGGVLVDLHGVAHSLVPAAEGDGLQGLGALRGEDVGNLGVVGKTGAGADAAVPALAGGDDVAGAVVLVVMRVVVDGLGIIEVDTAFEHGGIRVGDVGIAAVELAGAPAVLADPGAVLGRTVRRELGGRDAVIPANQSDSMVGPLVGAAVLAGVVDGAGVGVAVAGLIVGNVACAVIHDGLLDGVDIRRGNPDGVLDVADVGAVGILAVQAGVGNRARIAVRQSGDGFGSRAAPALQGVGGHFAVAALVEAAAARFGLVAVQHTLSVIGAGVVEEAVLRLGEVQAGGSSGTGADADAVLDHVGLDAGQCRMGPAGAVGVLVLDGGNPALIAAVPLAGQGAGRLGHFRAVELHGFAAQIGVGHCSRAVVVLVDQAVIARLIHGYFFLLELLRRGRDREYAQDEDHAEQKGENTLGKMHIIVSFDYYLEYRMKHDFLFVYFTTFSPDVQRKIC